jgi:hypothetical protein
MLQGTADQIETDLLATSVGGTAVTSVAGTAVGATRSKTGGTASGGTVTYSTPITPELLNETGFRAEFLQNALPTLRANLGKWYALTRNDPAYLMKEKALLETIRTLDIYNDIQTRTVLAGTAASGKRIGDLFVRAAYERIS